MKVCENRRVLGTQASSCKPRLSSVHRQTAPTLPTPPPCLATPWTAAYQAPPSMGFSTQEYWSGLPFPPPGDAIRRGEGAQRKRCRDPRCSPRGNPHQATEQVHLLYHMLEGFSLRWSHRGGVGRVGAVCLCTEERRGSQEERPESPALFCFHSDR